ncbi:MAG: PAS domain-containing protein [Dehalococcoidia bacterium]|nr:PAS domain-containing protein [Dehalococcoidia bacterium]
MPRETVTPISVERPFGLDELFFSTTDRKGHIRSGNHVFARVSGYPEAQLIGQPHNIIRHPDMPRAIFQLLWEYLEAERPIAAFVKNLARDGAYYWVLATAVPLDDGYLSVRMKPSSELLPVVTALYAELRELERGIEESGGIPRDAMAASRARLGRALSDLGFADYDAFMRVALPTELRSRQALLSQDARKLKGASATGQLGGVLTACQTLQRYLYRRFDEIDQYQQMNSTFVQGSEFVLGLAEDIRLFSLNAQIGAARLRETGAALGVIADLMRSRSDAAVRETHGMREEIDAVVGVLDSLAFNIALATLQCEMAAQFVRELASGSGSEEALEARARQQALVANVGALGHALRSRVAPLIRTLEDLDRRLSTIAEAATALSGELGRLDALQIAGRVETARIPSAADFRVLFDEIKAQIATGRDNLRQFGSVASSRKTEPAGESAAARDLSLARIEEWVADATTAPAAVATAEAA